MKIKGKPMSKTLKSTPKTPKRLKNKFSVTNADQGREVATKIKMPKKSKLKDMSVGEFLSEGIDDDSENSNIGIDEDEIKVKLSKSKVKEKKRKPTSPNISVSDESSGDELDENQKGSAIPSHRENLNKLKDADPEFYKFLEENDQELLNFDDSDIESDDGEGELHKPPEKLEVASDESDFEAEDGPGRSKDGDRRVTLKMVAQWHDKLKTDKSTNTLSEVLEAFHAALQHVSHESDHTPCRYTVDGAAVFNAVLRLCISEVQPALGLILKIPSGSKLHPTKCKAWVKVRHILMAYLLDLTKLCQVTSPDMLRVLLKHIHQMLPYAMCFSSIATRLLSRLVVLWTTDADVVRVLSFLCLLRIANLKRALYSSILKKLYIAFVRNTKFVSPTTQSGISFMRQSLAEMFALDPAVSYQHAFLYIRQLSVHLRNAVTLNKKESFQAVYNWQFMQSLHLWSELLSLAPDDSPLSGLVYPVVQIAIGTIKLIPSAQYFPLRFNCLQFLQELMERKNVYIPVLPLALEVLTDFDYNRKHSKVSMKPHDFSCILRCSKLQMQENGFKDAVVESACGILLSSFAGEAYRVSFPDTVVPAVIQLKNFIKICKVAKYVKQVKAVLDKVLENSKYVELERSKLSIRLDNAKNVAAAEAAIRAKGTPLMTYYQTWKKLNLQQKARKTADTAEIVDYKLPTINKNIKKREREEGPAELFPSDDDDDDDDVSPLLKEDVTISKKNKKKKTEKNESAKPKKTAKKAREETQLPDGYGENVDDVVEDFNISDYLD